MQLGLKPLLLRRLRAALQLIIPAAVAADTVRSCVVTYKLAQARLQEWEQEDNEAILLEVQALMQSVVRRCALEDYQFWPAALNPAAGAGAVAFVAEHADAQDKQDAASDLWQIVGLAKCSAMVGQPPGSSGGGEAPPTVHAMAAVDAAASKQPVTAAATAAARQGSTLVVVTLREALSHMAGSIASLQLPWGGLSAAAQPPPGVVRVTPRDVAAILVSTGPARAAAESSAKLGRRVLAAADAARDRLHATLPWPQLALSRKSALRCAVHWHGLRRPGPPPQPLERQLDCL